jgi:hypothetical protein
VRGFRCACVASAFVALSQIVDSQGQNALAMVYYTVFPRDGAEADLGFARRWSDAAETLMATKYHVVPDGYRMSVQLLSRPENDIVAFLAAEFGEGIHERLLTSGAAAFDEALAGETKPDSRIELFSRFRKWVAR